MNSKFAILGATMMILSAALAGCTSNEDAPPPAASTSVPKTSAPAPTTSAPPPPKPMPGLAYNETGAFTMESAPIFPSFNVTTSWQTLTIEYYLNVTSSCYVIGNEPPTGVGTGASPALRIKPPLSSEFEFELPPGPGSCGTVTGVVRHDSTEMANELGLWTVTVLGRGQNLDLSIRVSGE